MYEEFVQEASRLFAASLRHDRPQPQLDHCFDLQVDGNIIHARHLAGKPAPDIYLMAAKLLGVGPARTVVIEDALSGVEAGAAGNFGLVIGVARKGNAEELTQQGAHLVVKDLGELVD